MVSIRGRARAGLVGRKKFSPPARQNPAAQTIRVMLPIFLVSFRSEAIKPPWM